VDTKTLKTNIKERFQMKNSVKNLMPIPAGYVVLTKEPLQEE